MGELREEGVTVRGWRGLAVAMLGPAIVAASLLVSTSPASAVVPERPVSQMSFRDTRDCNVSNWEDWSCCLESVSAPRRVRRELLYTVIEVKSTIRCSGNARIQRFFMSRMDASIYNGDGVELNTTSLNLRRFTGSPGVAIRTQIQCYVDGDHEVFAGGGYFRYAWANSSRRVLVDEGISATSEFSGFC